MANLILVIGPSGSGKTTAGRNLDPESTVLIVPEAKEPPFRGWKKNYKREFKTDGVTPSAKGNLIYDASMSRIKEHLLNIGQKPMLKNVKTVLIDTITYALLESVMRETQNKDFAKFITFAEEFKSLIDTAKSLRDDLTIIITSHEDTTDGDGFSAGKKEFKIPAGRFTKEKIVPEGLFTVVLWTAIRGEEGSKEYCFRTQSDGMTPAKSPAGMFPELYIPNDYRYVIDCIDAYNNDNDPPLLANYGIGAPKPNAPDEKSNDSETF